MRYVQKTSVHLWLAVSCHIVDFLAFRCCSSLQKVVQQARVSWTFSKCQFYFTESRKWIRTFTFRISWPVCLKLGVGDLHVTALDNPKCRGNRCIWRYTLVNGVTSCLSICSSLSVRFVWNFAPAMCAEVDWLCPVQIGAVKSRLYLWASWTCPYLPYLLSDVVEVRYKRNARYADEYRWVSWKIGSEKAWFCGCNSYHLCMYRKTVRLLKTG
jgi:hypothetical protein